MDVSKAHVLIFILSASDWGLVLLANVHFASLEAGKHSGVRDSEISQQAGRGCSNPATNRSPALDMAR